MKDSIEGKNHQHVASPSAPLVVEGSKIESADQAADCSEDAEREEELRAIVQQIQDGGNKKIREVKKVAEFETSSGQIVYLIKTQSTMNRIIVAVHPENSSERLAELDGVVKVSSAHRFHSNMLRFPKAQHKGKAKTPYGWHISMDSIEDCLRILCRLR